MFAALSVRNFRLYFIGQTISVSGTWMQTVAQGWLVLRLTHNSVLDLAAVTALQWLPMLLFASYGGLVADRHHKQRILYITQTAAGLFALALGILVSTHHDSLTVILLLALGLGFVNMFDNPARQAFVQEMVGRELIANAVSLNSVLMNAGRLIGPSIAGGLIALVGVATCFYVNAFSYVAMIAALALMSQRDLRPIETVEREKRQLRLGLEYVRNEPFLRDILLSTFVVGTFAFNFTITLPVLTRVTFHETSPVRYTMILTAMGLGAIIGGLFVAHRSRPTVGLLAVLATAFGVFLTVVALAPSFLLAIIFMVPTGATSIAFVSTANGLLQLNSVERMRGRVMSLYATAFLGTTPIGVILVALIIRASNPRVGILTGSVLTLATGFWLLLSVRTKATERQVAVAR
jgi:predicted MFS family arabinose efflux permease